MKHIADIGKHGLCTACGGCAAVCPKAAVTLAEKLLPFPESRLSRKPMACSSSLSALHPARKMTSVSSTAAFFMLIPPYFNSRGRAFSMSVGSMAYCPSSMAQRSPEAP